MIIIILKIKEKKNCALGVWWRGTSFFYWVMIDLTNYIHGRIYCKYKSKENFNSAQLFSFICWEGREYVIIQSKK